MFEHPAYSVKTWKHRRCSQPHIKQVFECFCGKPNWYINCCDNFPASCLFKRTKIPLQINDISDQKPALLCKQTRIFSR